MAIDVNPGFQIGPVFFHYYGGVLAIAIFTAFLVAKIQAKRAKVEADIIEELAVILIISVIFGARLYHVLDFWRFYSANPLQIFDIWQGGMGIIGAIIAGILTILIYSKLKNLNFLRLADIAAPSLALAQAIGRIGNFINSEGFGPPTNLPWGVFIKPEVRPANFVQFSHFHPTFFYEAIGNFLIFLILICLPIKRVGAKLAFYLICYSVLRFSLEFLRIDTWQVGIIKIAQLIAFVGFLAGVGFLVRIFNFKLKWTFKFLP